MRFLHGISPLTKRIILFNKKKKKDKKKTKKSRNQILVLYYIGCRTLCVELCAFLIAFPNFFTFEIKFAMQ